MSADQKSYSKMIGKRVEILIPNFDPVYGVVVHEDEYEMVLEAHQKPVATIKMIDEREQDETS